jgi:hypothetical protein
VGQNPNRARFAYDDLLVYLIVVSKSAPLRLYWLISLTGSASMLPAWYRRWKYPSS